MATARRPPEIRFRPTASWVDLARTLTNASATFGDVVILRPDEGCVAHLLAHPEHVRHVLVTARSNYRKTISYERGRPVLGHSLLVRDDEGVADHRLMLHRVFQVDALSAVTRLVVDHMRQEAAAYWTPKAGTELDLHHEMDALFQRLMCVAVFGDTELIDDARLSRALMDVFRDLAEELETPFVRPRPRAANVSADLVLFNEWLEARVRTARSGGDGFLSRLSVAAAELAVANSNAVLRDESVSLLFAGYSTTSTAAAWCIKYLRTQPEAARAVFAELTDVADVESAVSSGMTITTAYIHEVLRLRPPAWLLARRVLDDDVLDGYLVPAGTLVLLAAHVTHRHPAFWTEPARFDLTRFTSGRVAAYSYFPFGAGFHHCVGSLFAMVLLRLAIVTLCRRFEFTPVRRVRDQPMRYRLDARREAGDSRTVTRPPEA